MVNLKSVQESNAALRSAAPGRVSLFVGATSGLGLATLTEFARCSNQPKVYIVGRSEAKLSKIVADLEKINPQGSYVPIRSEYALFKEVDAACEEFNRQEKSLDYLVMSPGYLKISRLDDNADGVEETISLRYYVRMRFVQNLLPQLSTPTTSRIVSIHGAGKEGHLDESDLLLQHTYSVRNAAMHTSTMNSLALQEIAASHPSISCVHVFPGLVVTPGFDTFSEDWSAPLRFLFRRFVLPVVQLMTVGLPESGARHLFHSTSARYPPASVGDPPEAGVPLPEGVEVAKGSDWKDASGCYLLNWDGETLGDRKLLDEYRESGMGKKIWEHTQEVFDRAAGKG